MDILEGKERKLSCLEHGFVELIDVMPRISDRGNAEEAIVRAARVSYGMDLSRKSTEADVGLITYLLVNYHTSPFEMVNFTFHLSMPIFVMRQFVRHRTFSLNEYSMRYGNASYVLKDVDKPWHRPIVSKEDIRIQSKSNKQMSSDETPDEQLADSILETFNKMEHLTSQIYNLYQDALTMGVSREIARSYLPLGTYTRLYASMDLHNLLRFLQLRLHEHAQEEIRVYAEAMMKLIEPLVPNVIKVFKDSRLDGLSFTRTETESLLLSDNIDQAIKHLGYSSRRGEEFRSKAERLGYE